MLQQTVWGKKGGERMKINKKALISLVSVIGIFVFAISPILAINTGFNYATALQLGTRDVRATIMQVINI